MTSIRPQRERIALKYLPERERTAIELRDQGLTWTKIGEQVNRNGPMAKQIHSKAMQRLNQLALGGLSDTPQSFYLQERYTEVMVGVAPRLKPGIYLDGGTFRRPRPVTITHFVLQSVNITRLRSVHP